MPRRYPPEVRRQVIDLARSGTRVAQLATTFGMSKATIYNWLKQDKIDRGEIDGTSTDQALERRIAEGRVVWTYPRRHIGYGLRQSIRTVAGGVLVLLGLIGLILRTNGGFYLLSGIKGDSLTTFPSLRELLMNGLTSILLLTIAVIGLGVGYSMTRGKRVAVLFLRRFGFQDATSVASYAAARTIGHTWRLVTLDNAEVASLGISGASSMLLQSTTLAHAIRRVWSRTHWVLTALIFSIISIQLLISLLHRGESKDALQEAQRKVVDALFNGRLSLDAIHATLPGIYAAVLLAYVFILLLAVVALVAKLASSFLGMDIARAAVTDAARTANDLQRLQVANTKDIGSVAHILAEGTRKIFASRFIVVRVAPKVWRPTVTRLSALARLILIDVSEPTDSLLWEIEHLTRAGLQSRCVFTCHGDRLEVLTTCPTGSPVLDRRKQRLSALLEGHQVLAYTSDRRGTRRFARALRIAFIDADQAATNAGARGDRR
jgi:Transposase